MSRWSKGAVTWLFGHVTICTSISIMWWQWHHQLYHCICLVKIIKMKYNITFLVMWCHLHILASHDAHGIVNSTTAFIMSRQLKCDVTWLCSLCNAIGTGLSIICYQLHKKWHYCFSYIKIIQMRCNTMFWSFHPTDTSISVTWCKKYHHFLRWRQLKWGTIWLILSCDATGIRSDITWCYCHWCCSVIPLHWHQQHIIWTAFFKGTIAFLRSRKLNWDSTWLFSHLKALALASVSQDTHKHHQWHHCIP